MDRQIEMLRLRVDELRVASCELHSKHRTSFFGGQGQDQYLAGLRRSIQLHFSLQLLRVELLASYRVKALARCIPYI